MPSNAKAAVFFSRCAHSLMRTPNAERAAQPAANSTAHMKKKKQATIILLPNPATQQHLRLRPPEETVSDLAVADNC
jgi:hypothetical protein